MHYCICVRKNLILVLHVINITFLEGCTIVSSMHMFACVNVQYHHTMTVIQYVRCLVRMWLIQWSPKGSITNKPEMEFFINWIKQQEIIRIILLNEVIQWDIFTKISFTTMYLCSLPISLSLSLLLSLSLSSVSNESTGNLSGHSVWYVSEALLGTLNPPPSIVGLRAIVSLTYIKEQRKIHDILKRQQSNYVVLSFSHRYHTE